MATAIEKRKPDPLLADIASYVSRARVGRAKAYRLARYCLMDGIGCAVAALDTPDCIKLIGPLVPGTRVAHGARVPGTQLQLDPVKAAFDISTLLRWHDYSDTWRSGGHPSDNLGGILATADWLSRSRIAAGRAPLVMRDVMNAMIKAYEIHGLLFDGHTFNRAEIGLDSVLVGKIASTAVVTQMLGGSVDDIVNAVSNAVIDGHPLNIYRVLEYVGSRKAWAAGDATSRGVWLALITMRGEMGYPSAFTAKTWGFQDVLYRGQTVDVPQPFGCFVMENITFKVPFPAQRNTQTAAECAVQLHPLVSRRLHEIERVELAIHERALRTNSVTGPITNFAGRDHCIEYVIAAALVDGRLSNESYENSYCTAHPEIEAVRAKIVTREEARYTRDYYDSNVRANPNSLQVFFKDGSRTPPVEVRFPLGDPSRHREALPCVERKFEANLAQRYPARQCASIAALFRDQRAFEQLPVNELMGALVL